MTEILGLYRGNLSEEERSIVVHQSDALSNTSQSI